MLWCWFIGDFCCINEFDCLWMSKCGVRDNIEFCGYRKPHVNVGTIGHVDHGKTTLTAAITKVSFFFPFFKMFTILFSNVSWSVLVIY